MLRIIVDAPRWVLLSALVYAPWAYGCTQAWSITILNILLGIALILWTGDLILRRRLPSIHAVLFCAVVAILLLGWWMTLNAHSLYDEEYHQFAPRMALLPNAPGSVAQESSLAMMLRVSTLLGTLLFVSDLSQRPIWRRRLWTTISLVGISIVAFGILQKIAQEPFLAWENGEGARTYFATYRYHANAGAFINLVWPLIAGTAMAKFAKSRSGHAAARGLWLGAALIGLSSSFINVSKAAMAIALALASVMGGWILIRNSHATGRHGARSRHLIAVVAITGIGLVAMVGMQVRWERWDDLFERQLNRRNERLLVSKVSFQMMRDAGPFGSGPGTWALNFPFYTNALGSEVKGIWRFAHQDYLQTLVEWGYAGTALWAVLFTGGIAFCFLNTRGQPSVERILLPAGGLALCGIATHALVDFPLQIASLQLYVAVYLGLGWGSSRWPRRTAPTRMRMELQATPPRDIQHAN